MAIYRLERKSISRVKGHNLVAAIAYRAGLELTDPNPLNPEATTYDYSKKSDVALTEIILPDELAAQMNGEGITLTLPEIANLVEKGETTLRGKMKMGAKLANEYVLAGSHELSLEENIKDFQEFAKQQAEEQGVITMVFVHDPKQGDDIYETGGDLTRKDERNIHAHIVLLSRQVELRNGKLSLGKKCDSDASNDERVRPVVPQNLVGEPDPVTGKPIQQGRGLCSNSEWLKGVRESWANIQNKSLARHNLALVTHKSYEELGIDFKPGHHRGKIGKNSYLGEKNESNYNGNRKQSKYAADCQADISEQRISDSKQRINSHEQRTIEIDRIIASRAGATDPFADAIRRSRAARESAVISCDQGSEAFDRAADDTIAAVRRLAGISSQGIKQRESELAKHAQYAENTKINLIRKILKRRKEENQIRLSWGESADDLEHAHKFDPRQLEILNAFANKYQLDKSRSEPYEAAEERQWNLVNNDDFFQDNIEVFDLVRDPKLEREKYNARKLSDSCQSVLSINSDVGYGEQSRGLDEPNNKLVMGNNIPRPKF
ncbi:MobA/MobL family protein [Psychrobacter sp. NPDC077938]|uniref:MobA/MobL family protein n=1 Tax=Psychrobacter sp. NPDC077938 TaxID=3364494 RepID=UPI0037CB3700